MNNGHTHHAQKPLSPIAETPARLIAIVIKIMIPSLRRSITERVAHTAVALDERGISAEHQCPGGHVGIVPASVSDGARIVHHGNAEARFNPLGAGGVDVIHGKAIEWIPFVVYAPNRQGDEQQVRSR